MDAIHIESGVIPVNFSNTVRKYTVNFKTQFTNPSVCLTVASGQVSAHSRAIIEVLENNGFKVQAYNADSTVSSGYVYWIAIEST